MKYLADAIICVVLLAAGILGLKFLGQKPEVPKKETADATAGVDVETAEVKAWSQPFNVAVDGEAVTYRVITVGAEVTGRIIKKTAAARGGTYVQKGDLLFEIDSQNYELEVQRLKALQKQTAEEINAIEVDLQNNQELLSIAEEDLRLQKRQLQRMLDLQQRRTANETEVESAMKLELTARNAVQSIKNQQRTLAQNQKTKQANAELVAAQLARAEADIPRCKVLSPIEGRIVEDEIEQGDYIKAGEVLVHISDGSKMEIKTKLRAKELAWIWQQQNGGQGTIASSEHDPLNIPRVPCEVAYDFEGVETVWQGYICRLEGTGIDRATRTFPCRVLVENPRETTINDSKGHATVTPPTLLSGMFVSIRIPVQSPLPLLKIPLESVRPGGQVWAAKDGKLQIKQIRLAHVDNQIALVRRDGSGLLEGDRVVTSPLASVRNDLPVNDMSSPKQTENGTPVEQKESAPSDKGAAE